MPTYDICCIASSKVSVKHLTHLLKRIQGDLSQVGGMVRRIDNLGLRPLASPIKRRSGKHIVGRYFRLIVEASPNACQGLAHRLSIDDEIIRFRSFRVPLADLYVPPSSNWEHNPIMSEAHYDALRRTTNIDYYIARTLLKLGKITKEELLALGTHKPKLEPAVEAYEELQAKIPTALARKLYEQGLIKEIGGNEYSEYVSAPTMNVAGLAEVPNYDSTDSKTAFTQSVHAADSLTRPFPTKYTSFQEESLRPLKGSYKEYREDWAIASPTENLKGIDEYQEPESDHENLPATFEKYINRDPDQFKDNMRKYLIERGILKDDFDAYHPLRDPHSTYERAVTNTETEYSIRGRPEPDPDTPGGLIETTYNFKADRTLLSIDRKKIAEPTEEDWRYGVKADEVRSDRVPWDGYTVATRSSRKHKTNVDRFNKMVAKVERELEAAHARGLSLNEFGELIFPDGNVVPQQPKRLSPIYGRVPDQYGPVTLSPEEIYKRGKHLDYIAQYYAQNSEVVEDEHADKQSESTKPEEDSFEPYTPPQNL